MMKKLNKMVRPVLVGLPQPPRLALAELQSALAEGATVIDTRPPGEFARSHLPGTINLPVDKAFTNWAGWLLNYDQPFYLIADTTATPQIVRDLLYIGLDNIGGYFDLSVLDAWRKAGDPLQHYEVATPAQIGDQVAAGQITLIAMPGEPLAFAEKLRGFRVILTNATGGEVSFAASDSRLSIVREARDRRGAWRAIEYLPSSWCGNSYHRVFLPAGHAWSFAAPEYAGPFRTRMRFVLRSDDRQIVSNEFEGSIDPAQFDRKVDVQSADIMNPYSP